MIEQVTVLSVAQGISLAATPVILIIAGSMIFSSAIPNKLFARVAGGTIASFGVAMRLVFLQVQLTGEADRVFAAWFVEYGLTSLGIAHLVVGGYLFHIGMETQQKQNWSEGFHYFILSALVAMAAIELLMVR